MKKISGTQSTTKKGTDAVTVISWLSVTDNNITTTSSKICNFLKSTHITGDTTFKVGYPLLFEKKIRRVA